MTIENIDTLLAVNVGGFAGDDISPVDHIVLPSMSPRRSVLANAIARDVSKPVMGHSTDSHQVLATTVMASQSPRRNLLALAITKGLTADIFDPAVTGSSKSSPRQYWS